MDQTWTEIASPQNPNIKEVVRLRNERHRKKKQKILVDGVREIMRASQAGFQMESLFVLQGPAPIQQNEAFWKVVQPLKRYQLNPAAFQKIAFGDRNEGVVAVFKERHSALEQLPLSDLPLILVLDGIEKPGNVGAVFRSASAAGVDAIVLTNSMCSPFNANAVRASLGTVFELPFAMDEVDSVTRYFEQRNIRIVTTRVDAEVDYTDFCYAQPVALVLGSEAFGVASAWHRFDSVILPMHRSVDSLNISATAAIVAFEARRQRKITPR